MRDAAAALEHLRKGGWRTGGYGYPNGPSCLVGALTTYHDRASGCDYSSSLATLAEVVMEQFPERTGYVYPHDETQSCETQSCELALIHFNDHPKTTFVDVELVLEKTALIEAERGDLLHDH